MNNQEQVELETFDRSYWIKQNEDLQELLKDKRFQNVILKGYCEKRAIDATSMLATPGVKASGERVDLFEQLTAISHLQYYFQMVQNIGASAQADADELDGIAEEE